MIENITLKGIATYKSEVEIKNLKPINFIYGANGCGKTTLTKFIDEPALLGFENCSLKWRGDFSLKTLVYNKDFRDRNFYNGQIAGVFTLGEATTEEIEKIVEMQKQLGEIKENGAGKKKSLDKLVIENDDAENEFKELLWSEIYKNNEIKFKDAFAGFMKKDTFKTKILTEFNNRSNHIRLLEDLTKTAKTIFGKQPREIPILKKLETSKIQEIENKPIWKKKVLGKADVEIATLIQRLNLNDWVNEGRNYLEDNLTCPFCQQETITENFRKQLEDYFDETFVSDTNFIKTYTSEYLRDSETLINYLLSVEQTEKSNPDNKLDLESFAALSKTLDTQLKANKELLHNKQKEPSRSIELQQTYEQVQSLNKLIDSANEEIVTHNKIADNYVSERNTLISDIWQYLVHEHATAIDLYDKKLKGLEAGIVNLSNARQKLLDDHNKLKIEISEANKNVTSVQPSIDEINRILKSYGYTNFEIVPSPQDKNQYQILREDGTIAESTLSEGEVTFITFLYFLQLAKGGISEDSISEDRVLIVDDPICSLDSNVLFVVSSLLKQIIKSIRTNEGNIKQIIVLTHNVYFHKEVSFIDGRTQEIGNTNFWILRKNDNITSIQEFGLKNPIHNSYELLWRELQNRTITSGIAIQNTMRRIIENYFKILGKYGDDDLIEKFESNEEREICRSLICWINEGSHSIPDDLFIEHHETVTEKYFTVFKDIFTKMGHLEHYNMMMKDAA
ncbi:MAG TPA: AAA family ATPase [Daejeonella sp.]|uniref:AAA family ATPase n=1 Tax=Daejeonella sp. TaxID=2805397 RepID=UPI002ED87102